MKQCHARHLLPNLPISRSAPRGATVTANSPLFENLPDYPLPPDYRPAIYPCATGDFQPWFDRVHRTRLRSTVAGLSLRVRTDCPTIM